MKTINNIGLALSGGGIRSIAQLGCLQALEEKGIKPKVISGVSAGAIIAALYSSGIKISNILDILCSQEFYDCSKPNFQDSVKIEELRGELYKYCCKDFESLIIPTYIGITNVIKGTVEYVNSGSLVDKVIASVSTPLLNSPVKINGEHYFDGGIVDDLPSYPLVGNCKKIIGMNVNPIDKEEVGNLMSMASWVLQKDSGSNIDGKKLCDILIEPKEMTKISFLKNTNAKDIFEIGYSETLRKVEINDII